MWIASQNGFYSIVKHDTIPNRWLIRSRVYNDLLTEFPANRIIILEKSDYQYRVQVDKCELADFLLEQGEIEYTNFKDHIKTLPTQRGKLPAYVQIWSILFSHYYFEENFKSKQNLLNLKDRKSVKDSENILKNGR